MNALGELHRSCDSKLPISVLNIEKMDPAPVPMVKVRARRGLKTVIRREVLCAPFLPHDLIANRKRDQRDRRQRT